MAVESLVEVVEPGTIVDPVTGKVDVTVLAVPLVRQGISVKSMSPRE